MQKVQVLTHVAKFEAKIQGSPRLGLAGKPLDFYGTTTKISY